MDPTIKPDHISWKLRTLSSDEIDHLLEASKNFRKEKSNITSRYLSCMRNGWWDSCTGEPITFDDKGKLVNGQHRLAACSTFQRETGKKLWWWCAEGVSSTHAANMDQGRGRSLRDYLVGLEVPYLGYASAIVVLQTQMFLLKSKGDEPLIGSAMLPHSKQERPSLAMQIDQLRRHRSSVEEWAKKAHDLVTVGMPRPGTLAAIGFQFAMQDEGAARLFFDRLIEGVSLERGDPIHTLRERLIEDRTSRRRMPKIEIGALVVKAWVAWNGGEAMKVLKWTRFGRGAEDFPNHRVAS